VTLIGTAPNAQAVGGALRVGSSARAASRRLREIQRGGGYWSVNSPTQLLGGREEIQALKVRFPGKDWRTVKVPPQAWEITINEAGEVRDRTAHASPAPSR
jgi:hypothetical protein